MLQGITRMGSPGFFHAVWHFILSMLLGLILAAILGVCAGMTGGWIALAIRGDGEGMIGVYIGACLGVLWGIWYGFQAFGGYLKWADNERQLNEIAEGMRRAQEEMYRL